MTTRISVFRPLIARILITTDESGQDEALAAACDHAMRRLVPHGKPLAGDLRAWKQELAMQRSKMPQCEPKPKKVEMDERQSSLFGGEANE